MDAEVGKFVEYELFSAENSAHTYSTFHVKLTDSSLKAIEDYIRSRETSCKPTVKFNGHSGTITIPDVVKSDRSLKKFEFTLSAISNDPNGSTECIRQDSSLGVSKGSFVQLGSLSHKLIVHANEDVYQTTKEKMTLADEESKKLCAKEIKSSDTKGKRIFKKVGGTLTPRSKGDIQSSIRNNKNITTSASKQSSSTLPISPVSLRERIIHLIAIRPYKRAELLARLMRDGLKDVEKDSIEHILKEIAQITFREGEIYTLAKHAYSEVKSDWPLYSEPDRQLLKRRMAQEANITKAPPPAVSPVHSNHGSPLNVVGQKRAAADQVDLLKLKKSRTIEKSSDNDEFENRCVNNGHKEAKLSSTLSTVNQQLAVGDSSLSKQSTSKDGLSLTSLSLSLSTEKCDENIVCCEEREKTDHLLKYPVILKDEQRQQYKKDFHTIYSEYIKLHGYMSTVAQKFKQLKKELQDTQEGSAEYASVKSKILQEYKHVKSDDRYMSHRKRFQYLHAKLSHIKQLIVDYDKMSTPTSI